MSTISTYVPTPEEIKNRFVIPRPQFQEIAKWIGIAESSLYAILSKRHAPSKMTRLLVEERTGIPQHVWDEDTDDIAEALYTNWYISNKLL